MVNTGLVRVRDIEATIDMGVLSASGAPSSVTARCRDAIASLAPQGIGTIPAPTASQLFADNRSTDDDVHHDERCDDQRLFGQRRRGCETSNSIGPSNADVMRRRNEGL